MAFTLIDSCLYCFDGEGYTMAADRNVTLSLLHKYKARYVNGEVLFTVKTMKS